MSTRFVDDAFFHYEHDIAGRPDVLDWISLNGHDISDFADFERLKAASVMSNGPSIEVTGSFLCLSETWQSFPHPGQLAVWTASTAMRAVCCRWTS